MTALLFKDNSVFLNERIFNTLDGWIRADYKGDNIWAIFKKKGNKFIQEKFILAPEPAKITCRYLYAMFKISMI